MIEKLLITATITFFYFQSPIINDLSGLLNCTKIENESYLTDYLLEQCTGNQRYTEWRNYFVIPCFCFFTIILSSIPLIYMHKNKDILFNEIVLRKIGFLLNGYSIQTFYW